MKQTLQILLILFLALAIPMATSFLLDIHWVAAQWSRRALVYLAMALQLLIGALAFYIKAKQMKSANR